MTPETEDRASKTRRTKAKRRLLPRFGLRTLLVVAVLFCLFFGWVGRNLYRIRQRDAAVEALLRAEARLYLETPGWRALEDTSQAMEPPDSSTAARLQDLALRAIGCRSSPPVVSVNIGWFEPAAPELEQALAALPRLEEVRHVSLAGSVFDDQSLKPLARLPRLEALELSATSVTSEGLANFEAPERIRSLVVTHHRRDRKTIAGVGPFVELRRLCVDYQRVSQEEVEAIATLPKLEALQLHHGSSPEGEAVYTPLSGARSLRSLSLLGRLHEGETKAIATLPNLERLWASSIRADDLQPFLQTPSLTTVYLYEGVPPDAAQRFSAERPDCEVFVWSLQGGTQRFVAGVDQQVGPRTEFPFPEDLDGL